MQLIQVQPPSHPRRWLLAGGVVALALGAAPASAGELTVVSLFSAAAAAHAAGGSSAVVISAGAPSGATAGGTDLQAGGEHAPVLAPGALTAGGTDGLSVKERERPAALMTTQHIRAVGTGSDSAGDHTPAPPPALAIGEMTPGGTDVQTSGELTPHPPMLTPDTTAAVGTDGLSVKERERPAALMTTQHFRPVGTGDASTGDHTPAPPPALAIGEMTAVGTDVLTSGELAPHPPMLTPDTTAAGGTDVLSAQDRERPAPLMTPEHARAVGSGTDASGAHAPHPAGVGGWTAFAAFPGAEDTLLAFGQSNRLSLALLSTFPSPSSALDLPGPILGLRVAASEGWVLVLADLGSEGVAVVDVADPAQPMLVALVR